MTSPMPNLYEIHGLDRAASSTELGRVIAGRDLEMEQQFIPDTDPRRRQLHTAFAVLADEGRRATYDDALTASLRMTWEDLEHLGNFGTFPDVSLRPQPQVPPASNAYAYPTYTPEAPQPGPFPDPFAVPPAFGAAVPAPQMYGGLPLPHVDRPSAGKRLGMLLLDALLFAMVTGVVLVGVDTSAGIGAILGGLLMAAWFIGFEVLTGASPVKHLFGYQVRNSTTGEKLSWEESAKRQWWRIINIVPGIGQMISVIGMVAIGISIKPENGFIGSHDRWAGAEVVRKPGR